MTAPTPEQMRALADDMDSNGHNWSGQPAHDFFEAASALRAAADQLEALMSSEPGPRTPGGGADEAEHSADGGSYDPLTDPANAQVIGALRASRPYFAPPESEDKVIAMLRERGLWKPENDHD